MQKPIPFSPPNITQAEIDAVVETLRSGWITTGPKTKRFETEIAAYCGASAAVCLNSATAGLELVLRMLEIGPGDEVITSPYTYAATANVILHVGAKPIFVDLGPDSYEMDLNLLAEAITDRTKLVMPVDFAGIPCDYPEIRRVLEQKKQKYSPKNSTLQTEFERIPILADAAHSFGAKFDGNRSGVLADFTVFSFHAVKNLTTGEGGAIVFNELPKTSVDEIYRKLMLLSLHGQSKDALAKMKAGAWKYQIEIPGYKYNMTDIAAAIGLVQLARYDAEILPARHTIAGLYDERLKSLTQIKRPVHRKINMESSYHLYPIHIEGASEADRADIIEYLAGKKISANVHFIPVVLHPAYTKLGYRISDFPRTYATYANEISLPIYPGLSNADVESVCAALKEAL